MTEDEVYELARAEFEKVAKGAGVETTEERWERLKGDYLKEARQVLREREEIARRERSEVQRREFVGALNEFCTERGFHLETQYDGWGGIEGLAIRGGDDNLLTHVKAELQDGRLVIDED